jgi:rubrerythrin
MGKFKESKTAKNLLISFAFESQANNRYLFFADQAKEDGYIHIAGIFKETADQEFEHARRFFKFFNGGELEITATFLTGVVKNTYENLLASAALEKNVNTNLYPTFAAVARDENYLRAAETWDALIIAERFHEKNFLRLAEEIKTGTAFKRNKKVVWRCTNCGYLHEGEEAPEQCVACLKPTGYFEEFRENI